MSCNYTNHVAAVIATITVIVVTIVIGQGTKMSSIQHSTRELRETSKRRYHNGCTGFSVGPSPMDQKRLLPRKGDVVVVIVTFSGY